MRVRCVCFDLGGVLVQINTTWEAALADAGLSSDRDLGHILNFEGLDRLHAEEISDEDYFTELAEFLGLSAEDARRTHLHILRSPYPGALELVQELRKKGLPVGGLSNTNWPHVREMTQSDRFPAVRALRPLVTSCEVRANKPSPLIYQAFEQASGFSGPQIVFFDDSEANVDAAEQFGWRCAVIDPAEDTAEQMRAYLMGLGLSFA